MRGREALRVGSDAAFVQAGLDHHRRMAERGGREVADLFRQRFGRGDESRAERDEDFADARGIAGDGGEVEGAGRDDRFERRAQQLLPGVGLADDEGERRLDALVLRESEDTLHAGLHLGEDAVLLVDASLERELRVFDADELGLEAGVGGGVEEEDQAARGRDVHRAGRVMDVDARFEVFAGVVVQDDRGLVALLARSAERVDERTGQGDHAAEAGELLVGRAFEGRLAEQRVLRRGRGEERVAHLIEQHVAAGVAVLEGQVEVLGQAVLQRAREHREVVGLAGAGRADERDDAVRAVEVAGRELTAAVRAGDVGAREAHRVEGEALVVEARRLEAQACVGAEDRVAAQVFMHGDAQRIAGVEARPADRAEVRAAILFGGEHRLAARADGSLFLGREQWRDLRKAEADFEPLRRAGEGVGGAAEFLGDVEEALRRELAELVAGLGVEQYPEVRTDEGEVLLVRGGGDQQGGGQLDRRGFGDVEALAQGGAVDQGGALA